MRRRVAKEARMTFDMAGRKQFEVPLNEADKIWLQLANSGIAATVVLPDEEKKAVIEVDNGVQAEGITALRTG